MNRFRNLKVYEKALAFTKLARQATRKFPKDEIFGLTSQFKKATDSIVLNIAEGAGNSTKKEYSRFLDYSIRSGFECIGCIDIALENSYIEQPLYQNLSYSVNEIIAMLHGLQKSLQQ